MIDSAGFDLNLLLAFDVLMKERSVTRAAAQLKVGQPAMSHALSRLRERLGDPLFVRDGGAMVPTPRALELAEPIARALSEIRTNVLPAGSFEPKHAERVFRLAMSDNIAVTVLPELLSDLERTAPRVKLTTGAVPADEIESALVDASIDLAIGYFPRIATPFRSEILFREELVCLFDSKACRISGRIKLSDYVAIPHLLVSLVGDLEGYVDKWLSEVEQTREIRLSTRSFLTVPYLLRGRRLIAAVPSRLARQFGRVMGLTVCPLPIKSRSYDIRMVWHARSAVDPSQVWLREAVHRAVSGGSRAA